MNVADIVSNPNVIGAAIGAAAVVAGRVLANRLGIQVKKEDAASRNLAAQLEGWENFANIWREETASMRRQIGILEEHVRRCEQENNDLRMRIFKLEGKFT